MPIGQHWVEIEKLIFLGVLKASFNSEIVNAFPSLLIYKNVQCSDSSTHVLGLQNWGQNFKVFFICELCHALCSILKLNDILVIITTYLINSSMPFFVFTSCNVVTIENSYITKQKK